MMAEMKTGIVMPVYKEGFPPSLILLLDLVVRYLNFKLVLVNNKLGGGMLLKDGNERCKEFLFPANIGCAGAWNFGIQQLHECGINTYLIINDDLEFFGVDADGLVDFLRSTHQRMGDNKELILLSECRWSCFVITYQAVLKYGLFDENFYPAYYEDVDYERRIQLLGDNISSMNFNCIRHKAVACGQDFVKKQQEYYIKKWGALNPKERFKTPFNLGVSVMTWRKQYDLF